MIVIKSFIIANMIVKHKCIYTNNDFIYYF